LDSRTNEFGQPIGPEVPGWEAALVPPREPILGRFCRIEPLNPDTHLDDLYDAFSADSDGVLWTYMFVGPFASKSAFGEWLTSVCSSNDPLFQVIIDISTKKAVGIATYMRIKPSVGVIEVGNITYSPHLQRTSLATEAMYLMMQRVFDELGYRRYEWKCDALNAPSRKAAKRLGFSFDGIFEQALVYKGRNRDTAWYSILNRDWVSLKKGYLQWLDEKNFDHQGVQKQKLEYFLEANRKP